MVVDISMNLVKHIIIFFSTLSIILSFSSCHEKVNNSSIESKVQEKYILKIEDEKLCLLNNNVAIKEYDVNIAVLPGEDIKILLEGIMVEDIAEADSVAENFDG